MAIKAISFDFWYTLFIEQRGGFERYSHRRRNLLAEAVLTQRSVLHSELDRACKVEAECHHRIWQEQHRTLPATERVSAILNELEVDLPGEAVAGLARNFEEGLLEHPPVLIDGAREVLTQLSRRYRLGIISDVGFSPGRVLKQVLASGGLLDMFDSLVFSDEAGRAKPHIEVFEATARSLLVEPGEIVHIGDLERTDIIGAKRAGFHAIRFTGITPIGEDETTIADFVTDDLAEIPGLVEMIDQSLVIGH
ncbi:MAG TPA: HAD family hydrolase [Blastocatellia bacterium]|nr:HAD family hydrolase [Blastocatellia bacterium]